MPATELQKRKKFEDQRLWIQQLVSSAQVGEYYGKINISFEKGQVQRVVKEESLKPPK